MGRGHRTCVICGIQERHCKEKLLFSNFPLDESRCKEWLKAVGNEELVYLPIEKLHSQRTVCGNHFIRKDFNKKGSRLKRRAIPKLNLSAPPLTDYQLKEFPLHVAKNNDAPRTPTVTSTMTTTVTSTVTATVPSKVTATVTSTVTAIVTSTVAVTSMSSVQQEENIGMDQSQKDYLRAKPSTSQQQRNILMDLSQNVQTPMKTVKRRKLESLETIEKENTKSQLDSVAPETSQNDLTPRKKKLLKELQKTKCNLNALKKSASLIEKIESTVLRDMVTSAIKNQSRKPTGRRWTTKNKISALAILKRSPKAYKYLQHLMPLPSIKTLQNVLKKVPMNPGINAAVIDHLRKVSGSKKQNDKYCTLVFDEMALKRRVFYDATGDQIEGYVDLGMTETSRSSDLADHALVFMLQGIREKYKQPVAFYFVKGTISSSKLAALIKDVIRAVGETGFTVLGTICDQGPTNMGAMNILRKFSPPNEDNLNYFKCDEEKVYIIYDVPHLFKSIRNNFLNYGEMFMNGMWAKWEHLLKVEEKNRALLYLSKISSMHVQPKYRAKMKVKYAAQILSNTVAAVLKLLAQAENNPIEAEQLMQTGQIVHDLDRLFDMTNGPSSPDDVKKGRRENVTSKTNHISAWAEYRAKLETVKFKNSKGTIAKNVRCINGYITTLRSLRDIWEKVNSLGFKYLNLRQLNQDALENLFGIIRQHSPTNRNPTCYSFIAALKTAIVSGMTAPHNRGSNCEKDYRKLLTDFHDVVFDNSQGTQDHSYINAKGAEPIGNIDESSIPVLSIPDEFEETVTNLADIEQQPVVYVSGYIASVILKKHSCLSCVNCLKADDGYENDPVYSYIALREWWTDKTSLTYPTLNLCRLIEAAIAIFESDVIPNLHQLNIAKLTVTLFMSKCDTYFITCEVHRDEIVNLIYCKLALLLIRRQCQRLNKNIALQEETSADAIKKAQQQGIAK